MIKLPIYRGAAERSLRWRWGQRSFGSRGRRGGWWRGGWGWGWGGTGGREPFHGRRSGGAWRRTQHTGAGGLRSARWKLGRTKWQKDGLMDAWNNRPDVWMILNFRDSSNKAWLYHDITACLCPLCFLYRPSYIPPCPWFFLPIWCPDFHSRAD